MRTVRLIAFGSFAAAILLSVLPVQAIENVHGKSYHLTKKHGPWMVMVASFQDVQIAEQRLAEQQGEKGLTPDQAAAELVYELRTKGIPAYTYSQDAKKGEIDTRDRLGRDDHRVYVAQRGMICVLAGNYDSAQDPVAQKTLNYIKKFHPSYLKNPKTGAVMSQDAANRGPLVGAFMTINPLVKPEEIVQRTVDKETKYLNSGINYPLVGNKHKYTVRVATFSGTSATPVGGSVYRNKEKNFDDKLKNSSFAILRAGEDAEQLAAFLRDKSKRDPNTPPAVCEAYVFHDKFQSIVTIGGFDTPDDPRIRMIASYYGVKLEPDLRLLTPEQKVSTDVDKQEVLNSLPKILTTHTEQLFAKGTDPTTSFPLQVWTFDPEPKVMPIPRIN